MVKFVLLSALAFVAGAIGLAEGHVLVIPEEARAGVVQRYGILIPSEKPVPTVRIEVQFPEGLEVTELEAVAGWRISSQRIRDRAISTVWEGGSIPPGQYAEFGLLAISPDKSTILTWKVIQTYQDGSETHWIGPPGAAFPGPTTRIRRSSGLWNVELSAGGAMIMALAAVVLAALAWRRAAKTGRQ